METILWGVLQKYRECSEALGRQKNDVQVLYNSEGEGDPNG